MEYYNNILCISKPELTEGNPKSENPKDWPIMTVDAYDKYIKKNILKKNKFSMHMREGKGLGHPALLAYDRLREDLQELIKAKYCDSKSPYDVVKHNTFKDKISDDLEARKFYRSYILSDGRRLPEENIEEYCANASILNALHNVITDRKAMRKALGGSTSKIWDKMAEVINALERDPKKGGWPHTLPANVRRLKDKYREYIKDGFESLIHSGFCNRNTEKM